jgi:hypothetical protein
MGWSIGYDLNHKRDIGYGVPAVCDHPDCNAEIDRGLSYVCGGEPFGGEHGCGLYFCSEHINYLEDYGLLEEIHGLSDDDLATQVCERCAQGKDHFPLKPDIQKWRDWKRIDPSWAKWREENPEEAAKL